VDSSELLADAFDRIHDGVHRVVQGLRPEHLAFRVDSEANTIGWLVWHLTRVEDDHLADAAQTEQVWLADGWFERFGLPFDERATGYGQRPDDVAAVQVSAELLLGYHDAVHQRSVRYVRGLGDAELDRIVDDSWTPPVSLGVRLVSVLSDCLQHAGQAAFIRGVAERSR
jgi:hypothetical protein